MHAPDALLAAEKGIRLLTLTFANTLFAFRRHIKVVQSTFDRLLHDDACAQPKEPNRALTSYPDRNTLYYIPPEMPTAAQKKMSECPQDIGHNGPINVHAHVT